MRAVSIVLVLLFHTSEIVSGGFIGVDVFFVISGFLITSLIQREIGEGKFTLHNFWVRRIRRIVPAFVACVAGTLILCGIIMLPEDFEKVAESATASSVTLANLHFWQDVGYFEGPSNAKPLLHAWSLAVEEQFYLFYPILLLGLATMRRIPVFHFLSFLFVCSFLLSIWGVANYPAATFYLLPTRAWELLLGGLLVFIPPMHLRRLPSELLGLTGLSLIMFSALFFTPQTPFPGIAAAIPCFGGMFVILANSDGHPTLARKLLVLKPVVFIGLISYSLYLWHWPVLAIMHYTLTEITLLTGSTATVISFTLAVSSWRWVEKPFRKPRLSKHTQKQTTRSWKPIFWGIGANLGVLAMAGTIIFFNGMVWRIRPEDRPFLEDVTWVGIDTYSSHGNSDYYRIGNTSLERDDFLVWGDSHLMMMSEVLDETAKEAGIAGRYVLTKGIPLTGVWIGMGRVPPYPDKERVVQYILDNHIPNVILVARWSAYTEGYSQADFLFEGGGTRYEEFIIGDEKTEVYNPAEGRRVLASQLSMMVEKLQANGTQVWLVEQVPEQLGPTAFPLFLQQHLGLKKDLYPTSWDNHIDRQSATNSILRSMERLGVRLVETQCHIFDDSSNPILVKDGKACYRDNDHLSRHGAMTLLKNELGQLMNRIANQM